MIRSLKERRNNTFRVSQHQLTFMAFHFFPHALKGFTLRCRSYSSSPLMADESCAPISRPRTHFQK